MVHVTEALAKAHALVCVPRRPRVLQRALRRRDAVRMCWQTAPVPLQKVRRVFSWLFPFRRHPAYLVDALLAAATNSCTLTIALSAASLAQMLSLGVESGY